MKILGSRGCPPRLLVVERDATARETLATLLRDQGAMVEAIGESAEAGAWCAAGQFDLVLLGSRDGGGDADFGDARVVVIERLMRPVQTGEILAVVQRHVEAARFEAQIDRLEARVANLTSLEILGQSAPMRSVVAQVAQLRLANDATILIAGEHGTGRELVARSIHEGSRRSAGGFVVVNCAALPESQLEAELFGYEAGALPGEQPGGKDGRIAQAVGGTILLDEIAAVAPGLQAKLYRMLQDRSYRRVGGVKERPAGARVIATTSVDLDAAVKHGTFRADLAQRLALIRIDVPPLRDRPEDIPVLAHNFLGRIGRGIGKAFAGFSEDAMETLTEHSWPGNVRELENAVEHAAMLCESGLIEERHLPRWDGGLPGGTDMIPREVVVELPAGDRSLRSVEKRLVALVLEETKWNISRAATMLGINRTTLYNKIKLHGLGTRPRRERVPS